MERRLARWSEALTQRCRRLCSFSHGRWVGDAEGFEAAPPGPGAGSGFSSLRGPRQVQRLLFQLRSSAEAAWRSTVEQAGKLV